MNDFARHERSRAFARAMEHLKASIGHLRAAQTEDQAFALNLYNLSEIDGQLMHAIHCCAHIYKQPPDAAA